MSFTQEKLNNKIRITNNKTLFKKFYRERAPAAPKRSLLIEDFVYLLVESKNPARKSFSSLFNGFKARPCFCAKKTVLYFFRLI